jgi:hypothetical protein
MLLTAEEIHLAYGYAIMAQNVVGGGDVEINVR